MPGMHCRIVLRHRRPGGADGAVCRGLLLPAVKYVRDTGYGRLPRRFRLSRREPVACELHSRYLRQSHQNGCVRDMSGWIVLLAELIAAVTLPSRLFLPGGYSCSDREAVSPGYLDQRDRFEVRRRVPPRSERHLRARLRQRGDRRELFSRVRPGVRSRMVRGGSRRRRGVAEAAATPTPRPRRGLSVGERPLNARSPQVLVQQRLPSRRADHRARRRRM